MINITRAKPSRPPLKSTCTVCGKTFRNRDLRPAYSVRPGVAELIARDFPNWNDGDFICRDDLSTYRRRYVEGLLEEERGEIGQLERQVLQSLESGQTITQPLDAVFEENSTFAEVMADRVASFGGSWTFILSFCAILLLWMAMNVTGWLFRPFDAYPFILLNLVLSSLAALQAPVIMMSQRRQETKDRQRAENDYQINLKAELEIRQLHEKIDHQLARQWERLAEMQQIQIELLEERSDRNSR